jgi:membrane protease YdiL (CAAX protease family)
MQSSQKLLASGAIVVASMAAMFTLPSKFFLPAAYVSTACMFLGAVSVGGYRSLFKPTMRTTTLGLVSAAVLYLIFLGGNLMIQQLHPLGIGGSSENSIYGLIASPGTPIYVQVGVLLFDSVGYESFFRGVLQKRMRARLGVGSPFAVAAADACIHLLTLNPLWVVTTFIVDSIWGLTYHFTRDLSSSMTSHFVWDAAIFLLFPIR